MTATAGRLARSFVAAGLARGPAEVLDFFLPIWAGVSLGATPAQVGALTALEALVSLAVRPVAGLIADRHDRARVAAVGAALYALSFFGYAAAGGLALAYVAAIAGGCGGALFWVALRALVGERMRDDGGVYSRLLSAEGSATWIAFVVAMPLVPRIDYRGVFALGGVACLLAVVALLTAPPTRAARALTAPRLGQVARRMRPMLAVVAVTATAEAGVGLLLLLHLQHGFGLALGQIAMVFLPGFIAYTVLPEYLHRVVLAVGRTRVLSGALVGSAILAAGLSFAPDPVVIGALWLLSAATLAAAIPVEQSVVAEASDGSLGRGMGLYESATLVGGVTGPLLAGLLYQAGGWQWGCAGAAAVLLAGAVAVPRAVRRVGVPERPPLPEPTPSPAIPSGRLAPSGWLGAPVAPPALPEGARLVAGAAAPAAEAGRPPVDGAVGLSDDTAAAGSTADAAAAIRQERRRWLAHVGLFVVASAALAFAGLSFPVAAVAGELTRDQIVNGDLSGLPWPLKASRLWTVVVIADTVWSWGRIALLAARTRSGPAARS